ncbi:MAG: NmrA family NAD(P)-binding protein [Bacteroidetes bacterium]|nr:NmrA family NAD(P)-binding protein [Bacteroidota bacterium]
MIVIMGATGTVGRNVATTLLERGERIRVIGRSAERLQPFVALGAEAAVGNATEVAFLTEAFTQASSVFAMIPTKRDAENIRSYQNAFGEAIARALQNASVSHVVHLSSHGANQSEGTGPVKGLHDQEQRLNAIQGLNVLHLRPTYFMENFFASLPLIREHNVMAGAIQDEVPFAVIATQDIAPIAADALQKRNFVGTQIRELLGQRDITMKEVTTVFADELGLPDLSYRTVPAEEFKTALIDNGFSENGAREMLELSEAINEHRFAVEQPRTAINTTPTSIEDFAKTFATVYHG